LEEGQHPVEPPVVEAGDQPEGVGPLEETAADWLRDFLGQEQKFLLVGVNPQPRQMKDNPPRSVNLFPASPRWLRPPCRKPPTAWGEFDAVVTAASWAFCLAA
jgi:hypothetical protein